MGKRTTEMDLAELRGSRRWTETQAQRAIRAWKGSGETVTAFAKANGLVAQRLYWWRDRLDQEKAEKARARGSREVTVPSTPTPAPTFLPVIVKSAPATSDDEMGTTAAVTVRTRDGMRVDVARLDAASAAWVAALVRSLEEVPS